MSKNITILVEFHELEELAASDIAYDLTSRIFWEYDINGIVTVQDPETGEWITVPAAEFDYESFLYKHWDDQSLGIIMKKDDVQGRFMLAPCEMVFELDPDGPVRTLEGWNCPDVSYYLKALEDVVTERIPYVNCTMRY